MYEQMYEKIYRSMSAEPGLAHTSTAVSLSELRGEGLHDQLFS